MVTLPSPPPVDGSASAKLNPAVRAVRVFLKIYGNAPKFFAAAPGRVNVIGEHTDYNDGFVLPMAIGQETVMAAELVRDKTVTLHSLTTGETASFSLRGQLKPGEPSWTNYVRGVIAGFQGRGVTVPGFNAVIDSTIPLGGGLSSSAALEVATATFLEAATGHPLDPIEKALLCQQAEHEFAGVPCGIMDQFISVMGEKDHLMLLDCRSRTTELVPMVDPKVTLLIINTNVRHELAGGEYARRRAECQAAARYFKVSVLRDATPAQLKAVAKSMDPVLLRRARHIISENARTTETAQHIRAGDWERAGELMYASHDSLRDDYEVSCTELDVVVQAAREIGLAGGVYGCRMTGGGFGGCAVALVKTDAAQEVGRRIKDSYESRTRQVATVFASRPSAGARMLPIPGQRPRQ